MNYTIKRKPKSTVTMTVHMSADAVAAAEEKVLREYARRIRIEGFRPGKAPLGRVKDRIDGAELAAAVTEHAVTDAVRTIADKEHMRILGAPHADIVSRRPDLTVEITATVFPDVVLPDYRSIAAETRKEKKSQTVGEKEVDDSIAWIRNSRASYVTVARPAEKGDRVEVDASVTDGGVAIESGQLKRHPVALGEGGFISGFEDHIVGMKEGEEKRFSLTMPESYPNNLGGKRLDFLVSVKLVQEKRLPELNDAFARGIGAFASLADLRKSVSDGLMREKEEKERQRISALILERIAGKADIDVPDALVDSEIGVMLSEFKQHLEQIGMAYEQYLAHIKKTEDDLKKEWRSDAETRVRKALCLKKIADSERIEPTGEEVEEKANHSLEAFKNAGHDIAHIDKTALAEYSKSILKNEKVFEFLERQE